MAIFIMINSMAIFIMINSMAIFIMINLFQEISESCFDHLHLRKASFHGGSSYRIDKQMFAMTLKLGNIAMSMHVRG